MNNNEFKNLFSNLGNCLDEQFAAIKDNINILESTLSTTTMEVKALQAENKKLYNKLDIMKYKLRNLANILYEIGEEL